MQPLPTEAVPRSVCARCGEPLPPPNGSATFVYGVGAVGYQNCAKCGAKWRYLWQDPPTVRVKPEGGRRLVLLFAGLALVVGVVVAGIALARSQPWNSGSSTRQPAPATSPSTASTTPSTARPTTGVDEVGGDVFNLLSEGSNADRDDFMRWANTTAQSTPQFQVNLRTLKYLKTANTQLDALEQTPWADVASGSIDKLVDAEKNFLLDVESIHSGLLGSPSFVEKLNSEASDIRDADNAVRGDFGLPTT